MNYKELCLRLLKAESEKDVIEVLKSYKCWDDDSKWQPFSGNENNWSIIGNQQGNPAAALVEKLVNSVDAVLMRVKYPKSEDKCLRRFGQHRWLAAS